MLVVKMFLLLLFTGVVAVRWLVGCCGILVRIVSTWRRAETPIIIDLCRALIVDINFSGNKSISCISFYM